jgi:hypothetical protein
MTDLSKGIIIIAQGKQRYINMAKEIAVSLALSNPKIPRALVTDSADASLNSLYDIILPIDTQLGVGYKQKLHMYEYSPFQKTLFIDVDCMVLQNIDWIFEKFNGKAVSVMGRKVFNGNAIGTSVEKLKNELGIDYLLMFNGGVYYFEKGDLAKQVFNKSVELYHNNYDSLGLIKFGGQPGDEPVMSIAMAMFNMEPIDDEGKGMYTPIGQSGVFKMDVLHGQCEFYKSGVKVTPAIMHFGGGWPEAFHYKREALKLHLVYYYKLPRSFVSILVNGIYNPSYIIYIFFYRIFKKIIKGGPLKFTPLMPMFKFE